MQAYRLECFQHKAIDAVRTQLSPYFSAGKLTQQNGYTWLFRPNGSHFAKTPEQLLAELVQARVLDSWEAIEDPGERKVPRGKTLAEIGERLAMGERLTLTQQKALWSEIQALDANYHAVKKERDSLRIDVAEAGQHERRLVKDYNAYATLLRDELHVEISMRFDAENNEMYSAKDTDSGQILARDTDKWSLYRKLFALRYGGERSING
jgi:hypothetical protein